MNRFEKKCFIASATFHGLLLVVFFCGSAFFSSKTPRDMGPVITIENVTVTDGQSRGGGNPNAKQEPPPPAPQPEPPAPQPPPQKEIVKQEQKPKETPKEKPIDKGELPINNRITKPKTEKDTAKSSLTQKVIKRTDTNYLAQLKRDADERARREKAESMRLAAERKQFTDAVNDAVGVGKTLGKRTVAEAPGPGGEAYVNYGSLIGETYKRAVLSSQPQSDNDEEAVIRVVVARSGAVRDSQWVRRTANPVLNKAVDRAMTSVRSLPEFPSGSKDSERTFTIRIFVEARKVSA